MPKKTCVIIGGGAIGLAIGREVGSLYEQTFVLDKGHELGAHASGRSSQVIHAGIYYTPGSLKATHCVRGNDLLYQFCEEYNIPVNHCGKLIVATNENEMGELEKLLLKSQQNGVSGVNIISGKEAQKMEPNVTAHSALYVPTSGVFDSSAYLLKLKGLAEKNNAYYCACTKVIGIGKIDDGFNVKVDMEGNEEEIHADIVINAAGLWGDKIARMINPKSSFEIKAIRGEAARFNLRDDKPEIHVKMNVYPVPHSYDLGNGKNTHTTGVHLTPIVGPSGLTQEILIGPLYANPQHREEYRVSNSMEEFHKRIHSFFPNLKLEDLRARDSGNSAKLMHTKDFHIAWDEGAINVIGIDSPGLTASLSIAQKVCDMIENE